MKLLGKLVAAVAVLFAVSVLTYLTTDLLPGNAAEVVAAGAHRAGDKAYVAEIASGLRLDQPWPARYGHWIGGVLTGNFGRSYVPPTEPVSAELARTLPNTLQLVLLAQLVALLIAVPVGVFSGYRAGRLFDKLTTGLSLLALAVPSFVLAIVLIVLFSVQAHWLPTTFTPVSSGGWAASLRSSVIPVACLAVGPIAIYTRLLRSDMLNTLQEDFVLNARAKGLSPGYILFRHALRPSLQSLSTVVAINMGALISGSIVIENIFAVNGVGNLLVQAISTRDLPTIQGIVFLVCALYVLVLLAVDLLHPVIDPRIRRG